LNVCPIVRVLEISWSVRRGDFILSLYVMVGATATCGTPDGSDTVMTTFEGAVLLSLPLVGGTVLV
jgi:hypothetical protein